jgi:hypothetical protein
MNSPSPTPSSAHGRTSRKAAKGVAWLPHISERQTEAYLLAREALRRIQRTSSLVGAMSQPAAGSGLRAQGDRHQSH